MDKHKKLTILLIGLLFALNITTNIYLRVRIAAFDRLRLFHEKLVVAYDIAGEEGVKKELLIIRASNKSKIVDRFLKQAESNIYSSKDTGEFLHSRVEKENKDLFVTRLALMILSAAIFIILIFRVAKYKKAALKGNN